MMYDTEKSELICEYEFGGPGDFYYVSESLYKSSKDQFFIEYEGGASSVYSVNCGPNTTTGSDGIRLLDDQQAREFIESHGTAEDYINVFGEPELG